MKPLFLIITFFYVSTFCIHTFSMEFNLSQKYNFEALPKEIVLLVLKDIPGVASKIAFGRTSQLHYKLLHNLSDECLFQRPLLLNKYPYIHALAHYHRYYNQYGMGKPTIIQLLIDNGDEHNAVIRKQIGNFFNINPDSSKEITEKVITFGDIQQAIRKNCSASTYLCLKRSSIKGLRDQYPFSYWVWETPKNETDSEEHDKHREIFTQLITHGFKINYRLTSYNPLHLAGDNAKIVKLLLENGADVNTIDGTKNTTLHITKTSKVVKLLIAYGANLEAKNEKKQTPLEIVARHDYGKDIIPLLLAAGAQEVATALNIACTSSQLKNIDLLFSEGINAPSTYTPLHWVSHINNPELVQRILDTCTADVNSNHGGWVPTPLHNASYNNKKIVIIWLINHGADINSQSPEGNTPLHLACQGGGKFETVKILLEAGADKTIKNKENQTPLDVERRWPNNNAEVIKLLSSSSCPMF